jgi:hypothetical protein
MQISVTHKIFPNFFGFLTLIRVNTTLINNLQTHRLCFFEIVTMKMNTDFNAYIESHHIVRVVSLNNGLK